MYLGCVDGDWVKLPDISTKSKVTYKIQTASSFVNLHPSSSLSNSDVLSSVFSYDSTKTPAAATTSTTTSSNFMNSPSKTPNTKKYFISTVTSKAINAVPDVIADRVDYGELDMEPVKLVPKGAIIKKRIQYFNQTVPMHVVPRFVESSVNIPSQTAFDGDDTGDDGVTVVDEDDGLTSSEETISEEEYYEDDEAPKETSSTTTTTTTKAPRKATPIRKTTFVRPQRLIINSAKMKHSHLNFGSFLKFLKSIQDSFTSRTAKTINDKIKMLREFRDNLILTINQRIKSLWKTQSKAEKINKHNRMKRTLGGGGGWMEQGGMDFPSAESALLSISFLTFAVFLIKLVLVREKEEIVEENIFNRLLTYLQQVIQTIKMKKYSWATQMNSDAANVIIKRSRTSRDASFYNPDDMIYSPYFLSNSISHFEPQFQQSFSQSFPHLLWNLTVK